MNGPPRPSKNKKSETKSPKVATKKAKTSETPAKVEEKQKREAAIESSKLLAARLLENKVLPSPQSNSTQHNPAQKPVQLNMQPNITSSTNTQPIIQHSNTTQSQLYTPVNTIPQVTESLQQNYMAGYNTENVYDWNYFGSNYTNSASEYFANSLSSEVASPTTDCSKCLPYINALDQRVKYLEEKVEALASAMSTSSKSIQSVQQTSKPFNHWPCSQTVAQTSDTLETQAIDEQNSQQKNGSEVRDYLETAFFKKVFKSFYEHFFFKLNMMQGKQA